MRFTWKLIGSQQLRLPNTSRSNLAPFFNGLVKEGSLHTGCLVSVAASGDSARMNWMLSCARHPLALLMGGSNEGTATRKRVCAL